MPTYLPIEVVTRILSSLDQSDLLNCRLVSQSWNHECLLLFRASNFRLHLNISSTGGGKAEKYIEFVSNTNSQLVIPIHLSLEILPQFMSHYEKTLLVVKSLQTLLGTDSILSLTMDLAWGVRYDKSIINCLSKMCHALKTLELTHVISEEQFTLDLKEKIAFPNLSTLKCFTHNTPFIHNPHTSQFLLRSPNLKKLYLREGSTDDVFLPSTLQKLVLKHLRNPQQFLKNIHECSSPPQLRTLKINTERADEGNCETIISILEFYSHTLKSLSIGVDRRMIQFNFPRLPHLESLKLIIMNGFTSWINAETLGLNSETFPSLKCFGLPMLYIMSKGSPIPCVKTLTMDYPHIDSIFCDVQEKLKNLKRIFPNATIISLKRIPTQSQTNFFLNELIHSELALQIQEIQIDGVYIDILGETMEWDTNSPQIMMINSGPGIRNHEAEALIKKGFELWTGKVGIEGIELEDDGTGVGRRVVFGGGLGIKSEHNMINVKKVKLVYRRHGQGPDLPLNLMSIAKNFPALMEIEFVDPRSESYRKEFEDLAIEYPNLLLKINKLRSKPK